MAESPPPTPTIPMCFQGRIVIATHHRTITNLVYYTGTPAPTTLAELRIIGNAIATHLFPSLADIYGSPTTISGIFCSWQTGSGSALEDITTGVSTSGTAGGADEADETSTSPDQLPPNTALIVKKLTGLPGPNKRGRWFFGGVSEEVQINGHVHPDFRNKVLAVCGAFASDVTVAASGTYAGGTFHARHWDRKTNTLEPIAVCRADFAFGTRKDRTIRQAVPILVV